MQIKQIEDQLVKAITKPKSYIKEILIVILSLILVYGVIFLTTKKEHIPVEVQTKIDSLTKVNAVLVQKQQDIDSILKTFEFKIKQVDARVDNIKERTIIIRKYYHTQSQAASTYTPTQIDSFFRQRYNY
jgi:hypothetical protein